MTTVFLGGTCNNSTWREELISKLDSDKIEAFNPVVEDWTEEAQALEDKHKKYDDFCLYCINSEMAGPYSIFELGFDLGRSLGLRPERTIVCLLSERDEQAFTPTQLKGFTKMQKDITDNGGLIFNNLDDVANYLNTFERF